MTNVNQTRPSRRYTPSRDRSLTLTPPPVRRPSPEVGICRLQYQPRTRLRRSQRLTPQRFLSSSTDSPVVQPQIDSVDEPTVILDLGESPDEYSTHTANEVPSSTPSEDPTFTATEEVPSPPSSESIVSNVSRANTPGIQIKTEPVSRDSSPVALIKTKPIETDWALLDQLLDCDLFRTPADTVDTINKYWKGEVEKIIPFNIRPSGNAKFWDSDLLLALAQLACHTVECRPNAIDFLQTANRQRWDDTEGKRELRQEAKVTGAPDPKLLLAVDAEIALFTMCKAKHEKELKNDPKAYHIYMASKFKQNATDNGTRKGQKKRPAIDELSVLNVMAEVTGMNFYSPDPERDPSTSSGIKAPKSGAANNILRGRSASSEMIVLRNGVAHRVSRGRSTSPSRNSLENGGASPKKSITKFLPPVLEPAPGSKGDDEDDDRMMAALYQAEEETQTALNRHAERKQAEAKKQAELERNYKSAELSYNKHSPSDGIVDLTESPPSTATNTKTNVAKSLSPNKSNVKRKLGDDTETTSNTTTANGAKMPLKKKRKSSSAASDNVGGSEQPQWLTEPKNPFEILPPDDASAEHLRAAMERMREWHDRKQKAAEEMFNMILD